MCGIAFWSKARRRSAIYDSRLLAQALLRQIESRGSHATGAAWWDADGRVVFQKEAVPGRVFAHRFDVTPGVTQGILHTRFATQGSPNVEGNNHPIVRPGIVMVHNGCIANDDDLFRTHGLQRLAEVDSEAIAAMIADGPDGMSLHDRITAPRGSAAIMWMHVDGTPDRPVIHLARLNSSPLVIGQTDCGDAIGASTQAHLVAACASAGVHLTWVEAVPEWTHVVVRSGRIETWETIPEPAWSKSGFTAQSWRTSGLRPGHITTTTTTSTRATLGGAARWPSKPSTSTREHQTYTELLRSIDADQRAQYDDDAHGPFEMAGTDREMADRDPYDDYIDAMAEADEVIDHEDIDDYLRWMEANEWRTGNTRHRLHEIEIDG